LPLVIHVRSGEGPGDDAVGPAFDLLADRAQGVTVVLHCFSAPPERVPQAAGRGWYCSFAGNVTYPKAVALRQAATLVPDELLLVETDSPFLAPQPARGEPNQPANVVASARVLAEERGTSYDRLETMLDANAARVFRW
jgi:TatD DNase family protein